MSAPTDMEFSEINQKEDEKLTTDNDNDSSDDDEDEGDDMNAEMKSEEEYEAKLKELEQVIETNAYNYEKYVEVIALLREHGDLTKLRSYREKMSQIFPLTESLWLDWLKDEQKFIESKEERSSIGELFARAVNDYLSVDVWLEYIQFSIGDLAEPNGIEKIRALCEKAVLCAGFHVTKGYKLWEAYRELENAMLAGMQQSFGGSVLTPDNTAKLNEQIERILRLFRLQLGVCLDNMESTMSELRDFDDTKLDEKTLKIYKYNLEMYKQHLEPFEQALESSANDPVQKLANYKSYIQFEHSQLADLEKKVSSKSNLNDNDYDYEMNKLDNCRMRLKCLYERALADNSNCLDVDLWLKYIEYLNENEMNNEQNEVQLKSNLNVFKRSTRNCPWSARLWINYAINMERLKTTERDVLKALYNQAMNAGLQTSKDYLEIWHAYIDYLRRQLTTHEANSPANQEELIEEIRDAFQKAINQLYDFFKNDGDPYFTLEKYWSQVEAKHFKCMEKARKIWNEMILKKGRSTKYAADWLEFYHLETQYGDEKHQRKLLNRALNEVVDRAEKEIIYDLLFKFEKLNGTVSQYNAIYLKYEIFKQSCEQEHNKYVSNKKFHLQTEKPSKDNQHKQSKNEPQTNKSNRDNEKRQTNITNEKNLKRKKSNDEAVETPAKKVDQDGFAVPNLPFATIETNSKKPKNDAIESTSSKEEIEPLKKPANINSNCTVFISNLSFDVDEEKLKAIFAKEPGYKDLRLIKHWSGKNKGYGYVDFEKPDQATNALKLDRTSVDGRPVFVSPNEDKSLDFGQNKFKYATRLEKNKLFVSGLPFSTDKDELEKIFSTFGKLKDCRIVTYKSGKSKGLAYVDFEDEASATKALMQTDGMHIGEQQISVAISNPPKRKTPDESFEPSNNGKSALSEKFKPQAASSSLGSGAISNRLDKSTISSNSASSITSFLPRTQLMNTRKKTLNLK